MAKKKAWIGVDLGGTKVRFTLFDDKFKILLDERRKTHAEKGESYFFNEYRAIVKDFLKHGKSHGLEIGGIGMGCPGFVNPEKGVIISAPNIVFLKNYPIREKIKKDTGLDLVILNDVQTGLLGEQFMGAAKGIPNVIGIFLGTGVGGAVILDGKLFRGSSGAAGEIGQFLVNPFGPLSGSDRHGILDDVAGRHAIAGQAAVFAAKQWAPTIFKEAETNVLKIKSKLLAQAIERGDKKIEELVRSRARLVGIVLSNLVNFLSPDLVLLGGGLTDAMPTLFTSEVRTAIQDFSIPFIAQKVTVKQAALKGHSVTVGAAKLASDAYHEDTTIS